MVVHAVSLLHSSNTHLQTGGLNLAGLALGTRFAGFWTRRGCGLQALNWQRLSDYMMRIIEDGRVTEDPIYFFTFALWLRYFISLFIELPCTIRGTWKARPYNAICRVELHTEYISYYCSNSHERFSEVEILMKHVIGLPRMLVSRCFIVLCFICWYLTQDVL